MRRLCADFPETHWVELEPNGYPQAFVEVLTGAGWLAALIPEEYGGAGLPLAGNHEFGDCVGSEKLLRLADPSAASRAGPRLGGQATQ